MVVWQCYSVVMVLQCCGVTEVLQSVVKLRTVKLVVTDGPRVDQSLLCKNFPSNENVVNLN